MKRFVVFAGSNYYPSAGLGDFVASFDTEEEAKLCVSDKKLQEESGSDWFLVEDLKDYGEFETVEEY